MEKTNPLKERQKVLGISKYEIAKRVGEAEGREPISCTSTINKALENPDNCRLDTLKKIVEAMGGKIVIQWKAEDVL